MIIIYGGVSMGVLLDVIQIILEVQGILTCLDLEW